MTRRLLIPFALVLAVAAGVPAAAETFSITLVNGTTFESRYQPREAAWDATYLVFLDGTGTWVALPQTEVASVASSAEERGYGRVIDTTTLDLGIAPNDLPQETAAQAGQRSPLEEMLTRSYDIQQFAEPAVFGDPGSGPTGGIPVFGVGSSGGGSFQAPPGITVPPIPPPPVAVPAAPAGGESPQ